MSLKVYNAFKFVMKYNDYAIALFNFEILILSYLGAPSEPPSETKSAKTDENQNKLDMNLVEVIMYLYLNFLALK